MAVVEDAGRPPARRADVDVGLFGPGSVAWRLHADPAVIIGGLRALMVQALNPLVMAGVEQHGDFRVDLWGRLARTAEYVQTTVFGDTAAARAAGKRVRAVHRRVRGIDPHTGRRYSAGDPALLAWIHNVEVHSLLVAYRRYAGRVSDADADRYVAEMVRAAQLVGLRPQQLPHDLAALRAYLRAQPLEASPAARQGLRLILYPPLPLHLRPLWSVFAAAAVGLLPRRAREEYGLPWFPPAEPAVRAAVFGLLRGLNLAMPGPPQLRQARARLAAS